MSNPEVYADEEGTVRPAELVVGRSPASCLGCGRPCSLRFGTDVMHVRCWVLSTAATRANPSAPLDGPPPAQQRHSDENGPDDEPGLFHLEEVLVEQDPPEDLLYADVPLRNQPAAAHASDDDATGPEVASSPEPTDGPPTADAPAAETTERATQRPAAPPPPARTADRAGFLGPAAVLDPTGVWLSDGTSTPPPHPIRHVGDVAALVEHFRLGTVTGRGLSEPGQVWLTAAMLTELGIDLTAMPTKPHLLREGLEHATKGSAFVTDAITAGFTIDKPKNEPTKTALSPFSRIRRSDSSQFVWVAALPAMNPDRLVMPILGDEPAPGVLADRLARFAAALQFPWTLHPGVTGIDLMLTTRHGHRDWFTPYDPVEPAQEGDLAADITWSRQPLDSERRLTYVHAYDRGGSHLAGAAGLELGVGKPVHHELGCTFSAKLPGYWQVEAGETGDWRIPHLLWPTENPPAEPIWVATPTLALAYEHDVIPPILQAYTWPEHTRILDPWYARIRDARTELDTDDPDDQLVRDLVKVVYTRTLGMLGSHQYMTGRPGYAPERRHMIQAKARANIMRRILQIGHDTNRWPLAINADTIVYASDVPDPAVAWPGKPDHQGRGLGQYKPEGSALMANHAHHFTGQGYRGKGDLTTGELQ